MGAITLDDLEVLNETDDYNIYLMGLYIDYTRKVKNDSYLTNMAYTLLTKLFNIEPKPKDDRENTSELTDAIIDFYDNTPKSLDLKDRLKRVEDRLKEIEDELWEV